VYRWVARNRYRLFRQRETCRLPTTEERARFLP
jgi:predicted DCC family thiol-disulfide oxidoreductase YuxK